MASYTQENKLLEELNLGEGDALFQLFDALKIPVYLKDIKGHYASCNQHLLKLIGLKDREEIIEKTDEELWGHSEGILCTESDRLALENGQSEINIVKVILGEKRFFSVTKTRVVNKNGNIVGVLAAFKELTEKNSQKPLNKDPLLEQIIDKVEASIYWKDLNGKILGCNKHVLDTFGVREKEQIIGKDECDFVSKKEAAKIKKIDQSVIDYGRYLGEEVCTVASGDKATLLTVKNRLCNEEGKAIGLVGTSLDISSYKRTKELKLNNALHNIAEKSHQMMQIIDLVNASIYWKDKKGRYLGCNKFVLDLAGVNSREQIIGKTDAELVWKAHAPVLMDIDKHVIKHGGYVGEEVFNRANGKEIIVLTVKNQLRDSDGNVIGIIGTSLDITAQKEAERSQTEAQKRAELLNLEMERERQQNKMLQLEKKAQQFLAEQQAKFNKIVDEAAHDMRNPLSTINTALSSCHELPEEKLTRLRQSLNNAFNILYNLDGHSSKRSSSASIGVESRQNLLIADYVDEIVDEKKFQYINHPIDFELHITEAAKTAHIDSQPGQLRRALSNIVNNAIDALPKDRNGAIRVWVDADEKWVEIAIRDNGIGMSPEAIKKIQQGISFTENKLHGHGHGLQQVGEMLEYNQGKMKIDSIVGTGTEFKLFFPRSTPANWLAKEIVLQPDTIFLLLEDDTSLHHSWQYMLQRLISRFPTFQLKCFVEGAEVLRFVQTLTDEERIRVLLLADYELTYQTKNGLQIIVDSQINNAILMTGHSSNAEVRKAALDLGINLLPKQFIDKVAIRLATDPYGDITH